MTYPNAFKEYEKEKNEIISNIHKLIEYYGFEEEDYDKLEGNIVNSIRFQKQRYIILNKKERK